MSSLFDLGKNVDTFAQLVRDAGFDLASLPPFLRVLLTTDGTVTKSLEAYFWEPVKVLKLAQFDLQLDAPLSSLNKAMGEQVLSREVELKGVNSAEAYAKAHSYICLEQLPAEIAEELQRERVGIGELLRELGLETYRELLSFERFEREEQYFLSRCYRIVMDKKPFIQITETFPLSTYLR